MSINVIEEAHPVESMRKRTNLDGVLDVDAFFDEQLTATRDALNLEEGGDVHHLQTRGAF